MTYKNVTITTGLLLMHMLILSQPSWKWKIR